MNDAQPATSRREHLAWCKQRALELVDAGNLDGATASMISDMGKHPETRIDPLLALLGLLELERGAPAVRRWIEGFN